MKSDFACGVAMLRSFASPIRGVVRAIFMALVTSASGQALAQHIEMTVDQQARYDADLNAWFAGKRAACAAAEANEAALFPRKRTDPAYGPALGAMAKCWRDYESRNKRPLEINYGTVTERRTAGQSASRNEASPQAAGSGTAALPSRVIARDGRSAMDCVKLVELTKTDSSTGGGRVLSNQCGNTVEIGWCYVGGDCESTGSQTNVAAGRSWPVSAEKEIRWAACHGANTFHHDPGSKGLQFTCSAPVK